MPIQGYQNGQIGPKTAKKEPKRTFDAISSRFGHICTVFDKEIPKIPSFHIFLRVLDFFGLRTRFWPVTAIFFWSAFDPYLFNVQTWCIIETVCGQMWRGKKFKNKSTIWILTWPSEINDFWHFLAKRWWIAIIISGSSVRVKKSENNQTNYS